MPSPQPRPSARGPGRRREPCPSARSFRTTSFGPDHTSSTAQTLTSTKPRGRASAHTVSSVMSVGTPADFFGQETQTVPSGLSLARNFTSAFSSSALRSRNRWTMSVLLASRETNSTSARRVSRSPFSRCNSRFDAPSQACHKPLTGVALRRPTLRPRRVFWSPFLRFSRVAPSAGCAVRWLLVSRLRDFQNRRIVLGVPCAEFSMSTAARTLAVGF